MLYELASPVYTVAALMVLGGVVFSAKSFFDHKVASLSARPENRGDTEAEA